jgi:hypothetical protein
MSETVWLTLGAEYRVKTEGNAGRVLDFWVDQGRHQHFWVVSPTGAERSSIAKTVNGIAVRILQRADLVASNRRTVARDRYTPAHVATIITRAARCC